jgi:predicted nucleotidyltransferase
VIKLISEQSQALDRFGVERLSLFGSVVREEAGPDSDIDVLVDFKEKATFDRYMDLKFFLEDLLGSRVDLVTRNALCPEMRSSIEQEAISIKETI